MVFRRTNLKFDVPRPEHCLHCYLRDLKSEGVVSFKSPPSAPSELFRVGKAGCQKEVSEELKAKRLEDMELMRAGKGEAWVRWVFVEPENPKDARFPAMYNDSKALGKILCS